MSPVSRPPCVGCGAVVSGRYCADCGEHAEPHDYSIKHFVTEALETIAHVDGRVFASFRSLLIRPGQLAADFLAGRDRKSTRLNSSHLGISYAVFCLKKKTTQLEGLQSINNNTRDEHT